MNFKKLLVLLTFIGLLLIVSFQLYKLSLLHGIKAKNKEPLGNSAVPPFEFEMLNGLSFTNMDLPTNDWPIVFMYMDPTCYDCEEMIEKIKKYYSEFESVHLYLITEADKLAISDFVQNNDLNSYTNIHVLLDKEQCMSSKESGLFVRECLLVR